MSISFEQIKNLIDEWDPIGLLSAGSPRDEYDAESREIFAMLQQPNNENLLNLSRIIYDTFLLSFGKDVFQKSVEDCKPIAKQMILK